MFNNRYRLFSIILAFSFSFSYGLSAFTVDRSEQGTEGSLQGGSQYIARHIVTWDPPSNQY